MTTTNSATFCSSAQKEFFSVFYKVNETNSVVWFRAITIIHNENITC